MHRETFRDPTQIIAHITQYAEAFAAVDAADGVLEGEDECDAQNSGLQPNRNTLKVKLAFELTHIFAETLVRKRLSERFRRYEETIWTLDLQR